MFKTLLARARQGYRTTGYPAEDPVLPPLFHGRPEIDVGRCMTGCRKCIEVCPTGALKLTEQVASLDMGRCIFCAECSAACPADAITFTADWQLAGSRPEEIVI